MDIIELMAYDPPFGAFMLGMFTLCALMTWNIYREVTRRERCCWKCKRTFMEERNRLIQDWKRRNPGKRLPESLRFDGWFQDAVTYEYVFTDEERHATASPDPVE